MIFELRNNILAKDGSVWVERGAYPVVRFFDAGRILLNVGLEKRELVVVSLWKGRITHGY